MGWTTPTDRATNYVVSATDWNVLEDNETFLYGDTGWTAVALFTNSWTTATFTPGYILLGRIVYLRGAITGGTANTSAFTLPAGYRPSQAAQFICVLNNLSTAMNVAVSTGGLVTPLTSATVWLSNITFPVV